MDIELMKAAAGEIPADKVIKNGKLVNVYSGEILDWDVAILGDKICAIGDVEKCIGEKTEIIDASGCYVMPGFIDGHIHQESTNLSVRSFAELVLKHGTTSIMTDYHEIGVVAGYEGIEAIMEEAEGTDLNIYFMVPSMIPFSPMLETTGGIFDNKIIAEALKHPKAVGLSEVVNLYVLEKDPALLEAMDITMNMNKVSDTHYTLQGTLSESSDSDMDVLMASGISTDHESLDAKEALLRLRSGCYVMMRNGSTARNMEEIAPVLMHERVDTNRVCIITDDLHTIDAVKNGHLDDAIRRAMAKGVPFVTAVQMVTINAAKCYELDKKIGAIGAGMRADINITTGPDDFKVLSCIAGGKVVSRDGELLVSYRNNTSHKPCLVNTTRFLKPITADSFKITVDKDAKSAKVLVMDTIFDTFITRKYETELPVIDGVVQCNPDDDVLYIAQCERYGKNGNVGKAFIRGWHLKKGAMASSMGHDNHNIIVMGTNFEDMALAANHVCEMGGGQCCVCDGEILGDIAFEVCGLLSDLPAEEAAAKKQVMIDAIHACGCDFTYPFMCMAFICLACIPDYAVTDHGFVDVWAFSVVDPVEEIYK